MSLCSNTGTAGTGEKGCQKYIGGQINLLWWSTEQDISITSLKNKPFVEALIYASSNRLSILKNAEYFEPVSPEADTHVPDYGTEEITSKTSAKIILKHKSGNCIRRTFGALDGEEIHVIIGTEKNVLTSERSSYDKLKTSKCRVNVIDEVIDGKREYRNIELTFDNPEWMAVKKDIQLEYSINDLTPLTGLYLHIDSCSAAADCEATITDCDDTLIDGLTIANITLYNVTLATVPVIGTVVDNGDGTYTIPITSGVASGETVEVRYAVPASDNLYVQVETEQFESAA